MKHWHILKILLVIFATYVVAKSDVQIVFLKVSCSCVSSRMKTLNCSTDLVQKRSTLSVYWTQTDDSQTFLARIQVFVLQLDQRKLKLYDVEFSMCEILNRVPRRNLVQIITNRLKEAAYNFPKKCPFKKDVIYGFKNLRMSADLVPSYLPDINFTATLETFVDKKPMVTLRVDGVLCTTQTTCATFFK